MTIEMLDYRPTECSRFLCEQLSLFSRTLANEMEVLGFIWGHSFPGFSADENPKALQWKLDHTHTTILL